ncbi:hypothetical protein CRENBAI_009001 [Crenichthys baileyi]|uniref:Uncharacterized protein n=1 Tax=Crenichthys baileyi TaxID=28760 RepID=A0AAV9QPG9_9TELE
MNEKKRSNVRRQELKSLADLKQRQALMLRHRADAQRKQELRRPADPQWKQEMVGFLGTGMMVDRLRQEGTSHFSSDLLKIRVKIGAS